MDGVGESYEVFVGYSTHKSGRRRPQTSALQNHLCKQSRDPFQKFHAFPVSGS